MFGSRDGEAAFFSGGRAGVFGELSTLDVVDRLGLPVVADPVVGCALGSGDGDDVVAVRGCGGSEYLAFFWGEASGEFVLDVQWLGDVGLVEGLLVILLYWVETTWDRDGFLLRMGKMLTFEPVTGKASTTAPRMARTKATSKRMSTNGLFNERGVK